MVCDNADAAGRVLGQLKATVRRNYSSPPGFGAQVVSQVLNDPELNALWQEEVEAMRTRISAMRVALVKSLQTALPAEDFSVGKYVELADAAVQDILARGKVCVIAGGTGLYVDSLIAGRTFAPVPSTGKRAVLEARMRAEGSEALLRELHSVDPEAAARLHPADEKRIIRALEVWQETGRTITEHNRETQKIPPRYAPVWLGLDFTNRADLYARIDRRVEIMLEQGLLDEIRSLLTSGVPETATSLQAIGYKEFFAYLRGESTLAAATALCQQRSRNYAKRQLTWFRRNPAMHWIFQPAQPDADAVFAAARQEIPFFAEEI